MARKGKSPTNETTVENRRARHHYTIEDTLECGVRLAGTEVKAIRAGQVSLNEGYVRATETPLSLMLHSVHVGEYAPAGPHRQHRPTAPRILLAHKREIRKLVVKTQQKGYTLVPLKLYFVRGMVKILVGVAIGKRQSDKRQDLAKRDAKRDMDRAMSRRF